MHKPTISPVPIKNPQRPVNRFADGISVMCPTEVPRTPTRNDRMKPFIIHSDIPTHGSLAVIIIIIIIIIIIMFYIYK